MSKDKYLHENNTNGAHKTCKMLIKIGVLVCDDWKNTSQKKEEKNPQHPMPQAEINSPIKNFFGLFYFWGFIFKNTGH